MRLLNTEVEKRVTVELDKTIKDDTVSGIMKFGVKNDYPQIIEKLIFGSQTAKAVSNIYAKFIFGDGFENESLGAIIVGKDYKGKPVTLNNICRSIAESLARFNGAYVHCNENLERKVVDTRLIPFKYCRLSRKDDIGFCAKIAVYDNWEKEVSQDRKFDKNKISWFNHFNLNESVFVSNVQEQGGIENFKGQIYSIFLDDTYIYPLSPFDSVYLDMDTEYQIQLFKNREIRNGFTDKIAMNIAPPKDEKDKEDTVNGIKKWMGPDGDKLLLFESEFNDQGELLQNGSFKVTEVKTNINDKLFDLWEKSLSNNIRKAAKGLPAVLIDYEMGTLGAASGEMIIQAVNYYNAITEPIRKTLSETIKDIYSNSTNETLATNQNWNLKPVKLLEEPVNNGQKYGTPPKTI